MMKQINFATITPQEIPGSAIGMPRGGRGLETPESLRVPVWLAKQAPADMDKAAVSRASQHGVGLQVRYESRFPSGPNGESLPSYQVAVACDASPTGDHIAAAADLRNFLTPAPARAIEAWLAELSVVVAKRRDDPFDEGLRLEAYASRLGQYPADVARSAIFKKPGWMFWPTWSELEKVCDTLVAPRNRMIFALENPPVPEPARRPATENERARVQELVDEMFPGVPQEWRDDAVGEAMKGNCIKDAATAKATP